MNTSRSPKTQLLSDRLRMAAPGELIPYTELSEIVQEDVQNGARHHLDRARHILTGDGITFDAVVNVGIERCTDSQLATRAPRYTGIARRASRKVVRKLACVQYYEGLKDDEKVSLTLHQSLNRTFLHFSDARKVKALANSHPDPIKEISPQKMLDMFEKVK
jgi:hypothetical protein